MIHVMACDIAYNFMHAACISLPNRTKLSFRKFKHWRRQLSNCCFFPPRLRFVCSEFSVLFANSLIGHVYVCAWSVPPWARFRFKVKVEVQLFSCFILSPQLITDQKQWPQLRLQSCRSTIGPRASEPLETWRTMLVNPDRTQLLCQLCYVSVMS